MSGNYSITIRANGTILTGSIYNSDHQNHVNNATPQGLGDYSDSVSQMQATSDPGEVGSEDLAGSGAGELERLRFMLAQMSGKTQWYENPDRSLDDVFSSTELQNKVEGDAGFDLDDASSTPGLRWYPMRFVGRMTVSTAAAAHYIPLVKRDETASGRETIHGELFFNRESGAANNKLTHKINVRASQTSLAGSHHADFWGEQTLNSSGDTLEFFLVELDWNGDTWIALQWVLTDANVNPDGYIYFSGIADLRDASTLQVLEQTDVSGVTSYSLGNQSTRFIGRDFDVWETASNSNGEAIRFWDGTQICFIDDLEAVQSGGSGRTVNATWTFPASFASGTTPTVTYIFSARDADLTGAVTRRDLSYFGLNGTPSGITESAVGVLVDAQNDFDDGDTVHFQLMAIGSW